MSKITELKNKVQGLERLLVIYNRYRSIRPEIWTWEKLGGRKDSNAFGERYSTVTHADLMVQNLEKESTSLYAKGTELAKSLGFTQMGGGSTTQSRLNQAKNQLQQAESQEKIKNEENQKKKQLLQIQSQINTINLNAVLIPDDGRNPNIKIMNTLSQKNAAINTKKLTEQMQQLTRQIKQEEIMQTEKEELLIIENKQKEEIKLQKEKREKELRELIRIEIQNEMQPIDIEILPTIVKPLDIDDVTKLSITSALAIGLGYLILRNK